MELNKIWFVCLVVIASSCSISHEIKNEECVSEDIVILEPIITFDDEEDQFFVIATDSFCYLTSGYHIHRMYDSLYSDSSINYKSFKAMVTTDGINPFFYNNNKDADDNYYDRKFAIDKKVMLEYRQEGIDTIISKYCRVEDDSLLYFSKEFKYNQRLTIAYCLWLEGYFFLYDGYSGLESFKKGYQVE